MSSYVTDRTHCGIGKPVAKTSTKLSETRFTHQDRKLTRLKGHEMLDVKINGIIWRIFMSATMKVTVHLGQQNEEKLRTTQNTDFEKDKALLDISQSLILNHKCEIYGICTTDWNTTPWMRLIWLHD